MWRFFYLVGSERVAVRVQGDSTPANNGVFYLLGDQLGSTSMVVSSSGKQVGELRFKAFGETRYSSGTVTTDYRYTGQRQEAGLGLYYFNARWYDPALGRFISPDSVTSGSDGMAWERYANVRDNPLRYLDPSGYKECDGKDFQTCGKTQPSRRYRPPSVAKTTVVDRPSSSSVVVMEDAGDHHHGAQVVGVNLSFLTVPAEDSYDPTTPSVVFSPNASPIENSAVGAPSAIGPLNSFLVGFVPPPTRFDAFGEVDYTVWEDGVTFDQVQLVNYSEQAAYLRFVRVSSPETLFSQVYPGELAKLPRGETVTFTTDTPVLLKFDLGTDVEVLVLLDTPREGGAPPSYATMGFVLSP